MKKILLLLIVLSVVVFAQDKTSDEEVKNTIENLFTVSKDKDYNTACDLIVYTGPDSKKDYLVPLDPKSKTELERAERIAKKIKAYLDISDSYKINSIVEEKSEDKNFTNVEVGFKSGEQVLEIDFKFIEVNNKLLLASIE